MDNGKTGKWPREENFARCSESTAQSNSDLDHRLARKEFNGPLDYPRTPPGRPGTATADSAGWQPYPSRSMESESVDVDCLVDLIGKMLSC